MAKFFQSQNNGVIAVIREDHAKLCSQAEKCGGDPLKLGVKVFTFCDHERLKRNPELRLYFTGDYEFLKRLLRTHTVETQSSDWSGYVPYSKQDFADTSYVTTAEDVYNTFGLMKS